MATDATIVHLTKAVNRLAEALEERSMREDVRRAEEAEAMEAWLSALAEDTGVGPPA